MGLERERVDFVVLDIGLPGEEGLENVGPVTSVGCGEPVIPLGLMESGEDGTCSRSGLELE